MSNSQVALMNLTADTAASHFASHANLTGQDKFAPDLSKMVDTLGTP